MQFEKYDILGLKKRPYNLLGLLAFILSILSVVLKDGKFDFNAQDTYWIVSSTSLYQYIAVVLFSLWVLYLIFNQWLLSASFTWLHLLATLLPVLIFLILIRLQPTVSEVPKRYYAFTDFEHKRNDYQIVIPYLILSIVLVIGQVCLGINIIGGVIKRLIKPAS